MEKSPTQDRLLDAAELLCRTQGYNAFSFRHLAEEVGIRTASIHYHFPTKADLGKALVVRYRQRFESALAEVERREKSAMGRLEGLVGILKGSLKDRNQMCLCGILAAEASTLPASVRDEMRRFFREMENWIATVLESGRKAKQLHFSGDPAQAATALAGALEGLMMSARAFDQDARLSGGARWLLSGLAGRN